ncbi:MAG: hypothetical protein R3F14_01380 [Polyangiaceae bacterium]
MLTLPLLPVCAAVLAAARRAQRARLGSIVAGSDRRARGILATTLVIATLEGLPDWPAPRGAPLFGPAPIVGFLALAGVCLLSILVADALALRAAKKALSTTLEERTDGEIQATPMSRPGGSIWGSGKACGPRWRAEGPCTASAIGLWRL